MERLALVIIRWRLGRVDTAHVRGQGANFDTGVNNF